MLKRYESPVITSPILTGAEIVVECLAAEAVPYVFGYPGGAVLNIYDALHKQNTVRHILVRHEQAAVHAADGFARSSGKVGVALVTSGPGVTNAVTGIATAFMDSVPLVVISGQVSLDAIGQDGFQECDAIGITRSIVKHSFLVKNIAELATVIKKAFYLARTGRPGPVLVDIPRDLAAQRSLFAYPPAVSIRSYRPRHTPDSAQVHMATELIRHAKRPLVYAGGGVISSGASEELNEFVDLLNFPCTNTLMGLGGYCGASPRFLGMLGMHGTYEANMAMQHCDLIIAVGARFDDRVIGNLEHFASSTRKIIHIDIDPTSIAKRVKVDVPIVGEASQVLRTLLQTLHTMPRTDNVSIGEWWAQINAWQDQKCLTYAHSKTVIKPQFVIEKLLEITQGEAFVTSDVGQHQMWAAQYYRFSKPRRWINSGGLGTMGVGLPYAMGVQLANPDATVACVTGEGSFQMCMQELATCKQYRLTPKIILLNNRSLGMVRQLQHVYNSSRYTESYMESLPEFRLLAAAYGHLGITVDRTSDVEAALRAAFAMKDKLVLLDFKTDQTENVWPMIPAGKGLSEMLLSSEDV